MIRMMQKANQTIPRERLWVNPDCGLKTRHWDEVIPKRPFFVSQTDLLAVLCLQRLLRQKSTSKFWRFCVFCDSYLVQVNPRPQTFLAPRFLFRPNIYFDGSFSNAPLQSYLGPQAFRTMLGYLECRLLGTSLPKGWSPPSPGKHGASCQRSSRGIMTSATLPRWFDLVSAIWNSFVDQIGW